MNLQRKLFYLYSGLWALYYLQGTLYKSGTILSQGVLAVTLVLSLFFCYNANKRNNRGNTVSYNYILSLNFLLIILTVYGFIGLLDGEVLGFSSFRILRPYYSSILPIYCFYYFFRHGAVKRIDIKIFFLVSFLTTIAFYFKNYFEFSQIKGVDEITNNVGYFFVIFVALLPLLNIKRIFKYLIIILIGYFVLISAKRGAMICYVVSLLQYFYFEIGKASFKTKFITLTVFGALLYFGYNFAVETIENNPYLSQRLNDTLEGNSSSRNLIYSRIVNQLLYEQNFLRTLFGYGIHGSLKVSGELAHNDWLEFAIDMGFLGLVLYSYYWVSFIRILFYIKNRKIRAALTLMITYFFIKTIFSQSLSDIYFVAAFIIGYCVSVEAYTNKHHQNVNNRKINYAKI